MRILLISIIILFVGSSFAQQVQWRGQNGSGIYPDTSLLKEWPADGPKLLLEAEGIGSGWGGVVLSEGKYYVSGKTDSTDFLSCLNSAGQIEWKSPIGASWGKTYSDARTTPVIDGENVYAMTGSGVLTCFNKHNGAIVWSKNVDQEYNAEQYKWGVSESPLVYQNMVISLPSGEQTSMVALDKTNGELIWKTESIGGHRMFVTPVLFHLENKTQVLGINSEFVFAVAPETGEVVWKFPISERFRGLNEPGKRTIINFINSPISSGNEILVSEGYDIGSIMLTVSEDGNTVQEKWIDRTLDAHIHGIVLVDGYVYGSNWHSNRFGEWVCLDWKTSEIKWIKEHYTKGAIISADDMIYTYDEKGHVCLIKPNPKEMEVVSEFIIEKGDGQHWAHPTIYNGHLHIRHGNYFAVYDLNK